MEIRAGVPFGELEADLVTNGLDAMRGEIRLVGVESGGVGGHHLRQ